MMKSNLPLAAILGGSQASGQIKKLSFCVVQATSEEFLILRNDDLEGLNRSIDNVCTARQSDRAMTQFYKKASARFISSSSPGSFGFRGLPG